MMTSKMGSYCSLIRRTSLKQLYYRIKKRTFKMKPLNNINFDLRICDNFFSYDFNAYAKYMNDDFILARQIVDEGIIQIQNKNIRLCNLKWNDNSDLLMSYELNYFDYAIKLIGYYLINDNIKAISVLIQMILNWIQESHLTTKILWDPYPISRRVWNWIFILKFLKAEHLITEEDLDNIVRSIYLQIEYLVKNLEYDLNNNHLTANGKTLLLAGKFFENEKWIQKGKRILEKRISLEINEFGFHDERSMSYHIGAMLDYCEVLCIVKNDDTLRKKIIEKLNMMSDALMYMIKPDGYVPLISDSVRGYPCREGEILNLCAILLRRSDLKRSQYESDLKLVSLIAGKKGVIAFSQISFHEYKYKKSEKSGNIVIRDKDLYLYFNCVPFGPGHCPGHSHCDALSIALNFKGADLFVDSGTYSYNDKFYRTYYKSTANHNTVQVGNLEQFEMLGDFRIGRLSDINCKIETINGNVQKCIAVFEHYLKEYKHTREITFNDNVLHIIDTVIINKKEKVQFGFILGKEIIPEVVNDHVILIRIGDQTFSMNIESDCEVKTSLDYNQKISTDWNEHINTTKIIIQSFNVDKIKCHISLNLN